ncbi:hypothetical protein N7478_009053 [Penicillium angulare]|uniref:uncharacterized protein n=1 Tax=Penicillium angulare TaxID=116970 RepID=UPI00254059B9|nr:uncharacterized protein N7478_009053 [Penicillium angulare]KAJ5273928.1 hypothetical protein N7478_009053 [Penicillium angulare]
MKLTWATAALLLCASGVTSLPTDAQTDLVERFGISGDYELEDVSELEKRRGGGGSGRSGGSSSSGGSSGGKSGSSSSSSGSSSSGGSSSGKTSSSSNTGGTSSKGSGVTPSYGNGRYDTTTNNYYGDYYDGSNGYNGYRGNGWGSGSSSDSYYPDSRPKKHKRPGDDSRAYGMNRYYAGGAITPYRAGRTSALGITPFLLPVAAFAFFPLLWYHPVYVYNYNDNYNYHNDETNKNSSLPVACLCEQYQECGCDNNSNATYYESLFNGTQPGNSTMVQVAKVNGTEKIWINGTLANGTTSADSSAATGSISTLLYSSGFWVTGVLVAAMVWTV